MEQESNMNGSHTAVVKTPFYPDAFSPKPCHENGITLADADQKVGTTPPGGNRNSPARRLDKGFETFMMTGDMIIRTSPHHKNDSPEKRIKMAVDRGAAENAGDGARKPPCGGAKNAGVVAPPSPKRPSKIPNPIVAPPSPKRPSKIPNPIASSPRCAKRMPPRTMPKSHIVCKDAAMDLENCSNVGGGHHAEVNTVDQSTNAVDHTFTPEASPLPEPLAASTTKPVITCPIVEEVFITSPPAEHVQLTMPMPAAEILLPETTTIILKQTPAIVPARPMPAAEIRSPEMTTIILKQVHTVVSDQGTETATAAESPRQRVMPLENVGILGVPRYADVPVHLDIPPDDISSEDERYRHDGLIDIDELPPPPDELLLDLIAAATAPRRDNACNDHVFIHQNSAPPMTTVRNGTASHKIECGSAMKRNCSDSDADKLVDPPGSTFGDDHGLVTSVSAEKLTHCSRGGGNPSPIGGVRNSKSHENYLESNMNGGGMTLVSIALDDNLASSVNVLQYEQSSAGSEDSLRQEDAFRAVQQSRSLNSSPEKKCDGVASGGDKLHTFIMLDDGPNGGVAVKTPSRVSGDGEPAMVERVEVYTNGTTTTDGDDDQPSAVAGVVDSITRRTLDLATPRNTNYSNSSSVVCSPPPRAAASRPPGAINEGRSDAELARHDEAVAKSYEVVASSPRRSPCSSSPSDCAPLTDIPVNSVVSPEAIDAGDWDAHSMYHQPVKEVDRPSAARLAKRLFNVEGFQRVDVARHLSKRNDFAYLVGEEYLKHFDLNDLSLDVALRCFLKRLTLTGETQECERILAHFSNHYVHCNSGVFNSEDSCHTLTCALMLLNTDLHTQTTGRRMSVSEFIDNLADLNDGENFPKEVLKNLYHAIKTEPLQFDLCSDDTSDASAALGVANSAIAVQSSAADAGRHASLNPFLEVPDPAKATEYKKGYVMRKCCVNSDGRHTPMGKRGWKMFYATLRDTVLYMHKDEHGFKRGALCDHSSNAIRVHHALASKATDYKKKQHVLQLKTADWALYLFQTSDSRECQEWIDTINFVAAMLSAPPLPSAIGSQRKFQRPLLPSSYTKLNMREQLQHHENMAAQLEAELTEHRRNAPEKGSKTRTIQQYCEKEAYLHYELKRFKMYTFLMQTRMTAYPELEPSLVEIAIGEVDEPPASPPADSHMTPVYPGATMPVTVSPRSRDNTVQRSQSDRSEDVYLEESRL